MENAVQFRPVARSFGTEEGRISVVVRAVVDMGMEGHERY
jgi:hypothetical protein